MYAAHHIRANQDYFFSYEPALAAMPVLCSDSLMTDSVLGAHSGCVFQVGGAMYFVPTQHVAGDDTLYITCDAQRVEGLVGGQRSRLVLGDRADRSVEDAILDHLCSSRQAKGDGASFVVTSWGQTFRL
jgi:hypothetical protein